LLFVCWPCLVQGDTKSDTWAAVDALGRALPGHATCGDPRPGKYVGIFYFLWLGQHGTGGPYDITKILAENPTNPQWGPLYAFHHWAESELGYYLSDDAWVMRRHCEQLVDAGIDTLIFDVTNAFTYTTNYMLLLATYQQIRNEGGRTPQVAFMAYNGNYAAAVQDIYTNLYSQNLYPDLWFYWKGKPLLLSPAAGLSQNVLNFFTIRQCWAWSNSWWWGDGHDKWTWLDHYPQNPGWHDPGVPEELSVCVAQHPTTNIGRSFRNGTEPPQGSSEPEKGWCFAEQWSRLLEPPVDTQAEIDPEFVFITGWNEWVAQRFVSDGTQTFLGRTLPAGETYFVDTYSQEYSRDIEPMKAGHTDTYYYQMINYVRRWKGVRAPDTPTAAKTITIDGAFSDWTDVGPEYFDTTGDTSHRNHAGWGSAGTYVNSTGRNDFVKLKVARDATYIYFYAETKANITSRTDPNWMLLFIDSDRNHATGWMGYDFLVNYPPIDSSSTNLKRSTGGWNWTLVRDVPYRYSGNKMEIRIPRSDLGLTGSRVTFDFHWADNMQKADDIIEFAISGDSAPNRRFNYRYDTAPGGPEVLDITGDRPSGTYKAGDVINVRVVFTAPVYVTGTPQIELVISGTGRTIDYSSGSGTNTLSFAYTVQPGDAATHLDYSSSNALSLNGGSIRDASGLDAGLRLAPPGLVYSLGYNRVIATDATPPAVTNVTSDTPNGTYKQGAIITVKVAFSEPVIKTGSPKLLLETGDTDRNIACSGVYGNTLSFPYTVQTGDATPDLEYAAADALTLPSGATITDIAGNPAVTILPQPYTTGSLGFNKDIAADGVRPRVTNVTSSAPDGPYRTGQQIELTTTWDEPVLTQGTPWLELETGDLDHNAYYLYGSGSNTLTMRYAVQPGDTSPDLDYRGLNSLQGTIRDAAGNNYYPQLPPPGQPGSLGYNRNLVILPSDGSIADAKRLPDGSPVGLGAKALYLKWPAFGYVEELGRCAGVRIEGAVSADAGDLVCLTGIMRTTTAGERYIQADATLVCGSHSVGPVGSSQKALRRAICDGLYVKVWGTVKPGSITSNSFVLLDGTDEAGLKVITQGLPGVVEGEFASLSGAAGFDGGRVIYRR